MAFSAHTNAEAMKEHYDTEEVLMRKVAQIGELVKASGHTCFFTGAGISTDAGIPDFRGPNGVWTCEAKGVAPPSGTSTLSAIPTPTHMAILQLLRAEKAHYLISQNCDGLHRRSGVPPHLISELHGNGNIEYCEDCGYQYLRDYACYRITNSSDHYTGRHCVNTINSTVCNGRLLESTIDFGQNLPEEPLQKAYDNSRQAELHIALGSSLTVSPACTMPKTTAKTNGKLVICNLQNTPLDYLCTVRVYHRCDVFMKALMDYLNIPIPEFQLIRRFKLSRTQDTETVNLQFSGIEYGTNGQEIPASLMRSVEISNGEISHSVAIQHGNQIPMFEFPFPVSFLFFRVHTMQHYAEPPLEFEITGGLNSLGCRFVLTFVYTPSNHSWQVLQDKSHLRVRMQDEKSELVPKVYSVKTQSVMCSGNIPTARLWSTLSKIKDKSGSYGVLLVGGISDGQNDRLLMFSHGVWSTFEVKSSQQSFYVEKARWSHSACVQEHYVFLFGGWDSESQYNDMWLIDTMEHTLLPLSCSGSIPSCRAGHSCTLADAQESLLVFGGSCCVNGDYEFYNDLYAFNPKNNSWKQILTEGDIPSPRSQHAAIQLGQHLLIMGGYNGKELLTDVYLLNLESCKWKKIATKGNGPPAKKTNTAAYRVYPANFAACLLELENQQYILYSGETGIFLFHLIDGTWSQPQPSFETNKGEVGISISTNSALVFGGVSSTNNETTSALKLLSIY